MSELISRDIDDNRPPAARNMPLEQEGDRDRESRYIRTEKRRGRERYLPDPSIANRPPDRARIHP